MPPSRNRENETIIEAPVDRNLLTKRYTERALEFIENNKEGPFFLYLPYTATHYPTIPHPDFSGKTGNGRWADTLHQIDQYNGMLLDAIDDLGISGNTIFISDPERLPVRNVPVAHLNMDLTGAFDSGQVAHHIGHALKRLDITEGENPMALALHWGGEPLHARLFALAEGICKSLPRTIADEKYPLVVVMDGDAGKTLGNILVKELDVGGEVQYARVQGGPSYAAQTVIDVPAKKVRAKVEVDCL